MKDRKLTIGVTAAVLVIWLVGAAITRYDLTEMAILAPVAVVAVGLTIGVFMLWFKIIRQLIRERGTKHPG